jgi:hypothetical protein
MCALDEESHATTQRRNEHQAQCLQVVASLRRKCGTPHGREILFGGGHAAMGNPWLISRLSSRVAAFYVLAL